MVVLSHKVYVDREGEMSASKKLNVGVGVVIPGLDDFVWCWMLQASRSVFSSRGLKADWLWNFRWPFYSRVLGRIGPKKTMKVADWVKKEKDLLNCKYKVTFQPDECMEPTWAATCFIHFGFCHRLDNILLLKCTFVVFYSFVCWWVSCECISKSKGISVYNITNGNISH